MSPTPILLITAAFLLGADAVKEPQPPAKQRRIVKPIRPLPPVRNLYRLRVQKTSRFPKAARPAASKPVSTNGLQVTIQSEKKEFAGNGPLAFEVVLTNRSKKGIILFSPNGLGKSPKLVISNQANANQWSIVGKLNSPAAFTTLAAGKSLTLTVVVEASFVRPIPFPQPRPGIRRGKAAPQIRIGKPGQIIGRPFRPPIIAVPNLPCGQGKCRARLLLEFHQGPQKREFLFPQWNGKIATGTVDFTVGQPQPIVAPGGPTTKQQAIRVAYPVAERALQSHYKPIANIRPAKVGVWIESPEKNAAVKKLAGGGWTVSWTKFPRTGHGHSVTVTVSATGASFVSAVFTSYSK